MNIHAVKSAEDLLSLFLLARWTGYEVERITDNEIRFRETDYPIWSYMSTADGSGDYVYYSRLAEQWDADGRRDNARDYW